jgi:hypothetical protein
MTSPYVSIHGSRLGLLGNGILQVDGIPMKGGGVPTLGKDIYVDSVTGADTSDGAVPGRALATLDAAFAKCTANKGYRIILLPNHAETVTAAGGITHDVAGVSVIGLGNYNQRPRILMDAGTASYDVTAADAYIDNIVFASGHLLSAFCFDVTGVGCHINNCQFDDNTTAENWGTPVKATGAANTADGLKITGCRWTPLVATVNALEFLEITDNIDDLVVSDNWISHEGTASPLILQAGSKVMHNAFIVDNFLSHKMTAGDLFLNNGGATNSGVVARNFCGNADVTGAQLGGAATGMRFFENLMTSTAVASGALEPVADTPLS